MSFVEQYKIDISVSTTNTDSIDTDSLKCKFLVFDTAEFLIKDLFPEDRYIIIKKAKRYTKGITQREHYLREYVDLNFSPIQASYFLYADLVEYNNLEFFRFSTTTGISNNPPKRGCLIGIVYLDCFVTIDKHLVYSGEKRSCIYNDQVIDEVATGAKADDIISLELWQYSTKTLKGIYTYDLSVSDDNNVIIKYKHSSARIVGFNNRNTLLASALDKSKQLVNKITQTRNLVRNLPGYKGK